jgi:biotin carboxyl carrier protein
VEENGRLRSFIVTVEPINISASTEIRAQSIPDSKVTNGTHVFSTFAGFVEVADIKVKVGDNVKKGMVIATIEAMKAEHDIKAPIDGTVSVIHVGIGDEIDSSKPILTIA